MEINKNNFVGPKGEPYVKGPTTNPPTEQDLATIRQIVHSRENKTITNNYNNIFLIILISIFIIAILVVIKKKKK